MNLVPTILLVEDSQDDAYFFKRALKRSGCECELEHVFDGGAAVQRLREALTDASRMPDLVFLDLKMPVLSGFEVLDWIRGQAFASTLQVIVLSGSDQEADRRRARELGAFDFIVKPITADGITARLQNLNANCPQPLSDR
jgi:CheY-like chemotaxis protein